MDTLAIWIAAGVIVLPILILVIVLPYSMVARRPRRPEERADHTVNEAQDEAEIFFRRQPPVG